MKSLLLTLVALLAACASAPPEGQERKLLRLHLYGSEQRFELASASHTDPLAYYSRVREDARRKVMPDDVMEAFVREFRKHGFASYAQSGRAPSRGSNVVLRALELQDGDTFLHWPIGRPSDLAEHEAFRESMEIFLEAYNLTQSYQAVRNEEGTGIFAEEGSGDR